MPILPIVELAKRTPQRLSPGIRVSPLLVEAAATDAEEVLRKLQTSNQGLSQEEAERRLAEYGPNLVTQEHRYGRIRLLGKALINPLVILLLILATLSFLTGDFRAGCVMILMVLLGVSLRFVQEAR